MKQLFFFLALMLGISMGLAQTNLTGTLTVDDTLDLAGSPYTITGNVTVSLGVTLTVDSGVVVMFNADKRLYVYGDLIATKATFTSSAASPARGDWEFIQVGNGTSAALVYLSECQVSYGDFILVHNNSTLNLQNSTLSDFSQQALRLYPTSSLDMTGGQITSSAWPIYLNGPATLLLDNTTDLTGNDRDAVFVNFTTLSTTWNLPKLPGSFPVEIPYYFNNHFTISATGWLDVESGAILKMRYSYSIYVDGVLKAVAAIGDSIRFTSDRDDNWGGDTNGDGGGTSPASRDWDGILFRDGSNDAECKLERCMIRYAGTTDRGGVGMEDASPTIQGCTFSFNYYGASIKYASDPIFMNNMIGSSERTPIVMSFEADPNFVNNEFSFSDNQYDGIGLYGGTLTRTAYLPVRSVTSVPNVTYIMLGGITIPAGDSLTIEPTIVLKPLSSTYNIRVDGTLIADGGSYANMITLTSIKDDNFGNPGDTNRDGSLSAPVIPDCGGIYFAPGSEGTLNFVRMKYMRVYSTSSFGQTIEGTVGISNADPVITNCNISESDYGIMCYHSSDPVISNDSLFNINNTPIGVSAMAAPTFSGNAFINAGYVGLGLIGGNVGVNGTIAKRNVGGYTNIAYVLLQNLTIDDGASVNVDPGVVIKMLASRIITVNGGFRTDGTLSEKVIFTSIKDDNHGNPMDTNGDGSASSPAMGDWNYIHFTATSDDMYCNFNHAELRFGGNSNTAPIIFENASGTLQNSLITDSERFGIRCEGTSMPAITNVVIQNCNGDPIAMSLKSDPVFTNISFIANGSQAIRILEGTLSSDATLEKRDVAGINNIAYIVGRLTIISGTKLTLEPGVVIKFPGESYANSDWFAVQGALVAIGTPSQKIIFTSFKDDSAGGDSNNDGNTTSPIAGDWDGINFYDSSDDLQNVLKHCEFRYGGTNPGYYSPFSAEEDHGMVKAKDSYVLVDSCLFQQSQGSAVGIYGSGNPHISNCEIYNMGEEPIHMAMFANPTFSNNTVLNVGRMAIGILPETWSQTATVPQRNFGGISNIGYFLYGTITINTGTTINIPAGTVFKRSSANGFLVNGRLDIDGSIPDPVVITDYRDDMYGNPGDMNQDGGATSPPASYSGDLITFSDVSDDASTLRHAILKYGADAIQLSSASPEINNVLAENCNYGVNLVGISQPAMDSCIFNDLKYAPFIVSLVSYPSSTLDNLISGTTYKAIEIVNETLSQDVTLIKREFGGIPNIPYLFGSYTVGTGATLTIEPGVVCKFKSNGYMTVDKGLIAEGGPTPDSSIVFTALTDDFYGGDTNADSTASSPNRGYWDGVRFTDQSLDPLCRLDHTIFRFSGPSNTIGAVTTISASPSIQNSVFTENLYAFIARGASNPVVNYCDFYANNYYGIWNKDLAFTINAEYNWWGSNTGPTHSGNPGGTGEVVSDMVDYTPWLTDAFNPLMGDVSLNGKIQAYDASLVLQYKVGLITLTNTQKTVSDVSGNGNISVGDASFILQYVAGLIQVFPAEEMAKMMQYGGTAGTNLVVGEVQAGAGSTVVLPVTLEGTEMMNGLYLDLRFDPDKLAFEEASFGNGSMQSAVNGNPAGQVQIALADIMDLPEGEIIWLRFKLSGDVEAGTVIPLEVNSFIANETDLTSQSQNGLIVVISATALDPDASGLQSFSVYPNPSNGLFNIRFYLERAQNSMRISVYNLAGVEVAELANGALPAGEHELSWEANSLPAGVYILRVEAVDVRAFQRIVLVR